MLLVFFFLTSLVIYSCFSFFIHKIAHQERKKSCREQTAQLCKADKNTSSNNIDNEDRFFVRQSSHPDDAPAMVHSFLDYLFDLLDKYLNALPVELSQAAEKIATELETEKFSKAKAEKESYLNLLKQYRTLATYGFNSGKS